MYLLLPAVSGSSFALKFAVNSISLSTLIRYAADLKFLHRLLSSLQIHTLLFASAILITSSPLHSCLFSGRSLQLPYIRIICFYCYFKRLSVTGGCGSSFAFKACLKFHIFVNCKRILCIFRNFSVHCPVHELIFAFVFYCRSCRYFLSCIVFVFCRIKRYCVTIFIVVLLFVVTVYVSSTGGFSFSLKFAFKFHISINCKLCNLLYRKLFRRLLSSSRTHIYFRLLLSQLPSLALLHCISFAGSSVTVPILSSFTLSLLYMSLSTGGFSSL